VWLLEIEETALEVLVGGDLRKSFVRPFQIQIQIHPFSALLNAHKRLAAPKNLAVRQKSDKPFSVKAVEKEAAD
jgi:hypothetical protein